MSDKRLQTMPLGRPPQFSNPATMPPFTAEQKMKDTVAKLAVRLQVSRSEVMRQAMKTGLRTMIHDIKTQAAQVAEGVDEEE